jgi:hypothetical protein
VGALECEVEPNFIELYEVLGDKEKQDQIRAAHPEVAHCPELQMSPNACMGCPKNPDRKRDALDFDEQLIIAWSDTITDVFAMLDNIRLGISVFTEKELSPEDAAMLREAQRFIREESPLESMVSETTIEPDGR